MGRKYQLVAYAFLLDENYGVQVRRGFVNYITEQKTVFLDITPTMKTYVKRVVSHLRTRIGDT